ncbi:DUF4251 domain-containing protein [Mucilaginibacter myungsuensis]|uniref:DUF4251 domain-containing protein n=1 Tax=Mucilaginibacter myungsuensis TaxID=649104 RepID=A0A929KZ40_9SPHI|nr:DUF4251 domain-containing protein [Mucilaginibacter myungsuensis]MBE9660331.1 DUF4251 domain-containing protein [Mucilaginibacter myungsuensis]MDN3600373.1 DUF4251 domain-containing protein [Mucilaginibacter myungsuensis]
MRALKTSIAALAIVFAGAFAAYPQNEKEDSKADKKAVKEAAVRKLVESKDFTFYVQSASPLRGGNVNIQYGYYDLKILPDTILSFLPYYGQAYLVPNAPRDGGIKFASTDFVYEAATRKNNYQIIIKPTDIKDVQRMILEVTPSGYATLFVNNTSRDAISFWGYVEANKKDKK